MCTAFVADSHTNVSNGDNVELFEYLVNHKGVCGWRAEDDKNTDKNAKQVVRITRTGISKWGKNNTTREEDTTDEMPFRWIREKRAYLPRLITPLRMRAVQQCPEGKPLIQITQSSVAYKRIKTKG